LSELPETFASVASLLPEGIAWRYEASVRAGRLSHTWAITGDRGAIHVNAYYSEHPKLGREWYGGIEAHSPINQSEYGDGKPSHEHCWLLNGPCWHDGSSLQFSEEIAPSLPYENREMSAREHRVVLYTMLSRYRSWLPEASAIEARRAETRTGSVADESAVPQADAPEVSA
jgi:hypothetical protein